MWSSCTHANTRAGGQGEDHAHSEQQPITAAELSENKAHMARSVGPCEPAAASAAEGGSARPRPRPCAHTHTHASRLFHLTPNDPPTERCHHDPVPRNTTGITATVPVTVGVRHRHAPQRETEPKPTEPRTETV